MTRPIRFASLSEYPPAYDEPIDECPACGEPLDADDQCERCADLRAREELAEAYEDMRQSRSEDADGYSTPAMLGRIVAVVTLVTGVALGDAVIVFAGLIIMAAALPQNGTPRGWWDERQARKAEQAKLDAHDRWRQS